MTRASRVSDYLRLIREMEPLIDQVAATKGTDPDAKAAAQAKWEEIWKEIRMIPLQHPFAIRGAYTTPGNRCLQKYSPDQTLERLLEDRPGLR